MTHRLIPAIAIAAAVICLGATDSFAANNDMKVCGEQWQAMKTAGTVAQGQTWKSFLKECRGRSAASGTTQAPAAASQTANSAPAPATSKRSKKTEASIASTATKPAAPAAKSTTAGALAEHSRIKACGAEWRAAKAAKTVQAGETWPKYWKACDARMKAAG